MLNLLPSFSSSTRLSLQAPPYLATVSPHMRHSHLLRTEALLAKRSVGKLLAVNTHPLILWLNFVLLFFSPRAIVTKLISFD